MNITRKKEALVLFLGDIFVLFAALYLTIVLRYNALPSSEILTLHLIPFTYLFIVSVLINFIAGLYEKHTLALKRKLRKILIQVQIANALVSVVFFYFIPYFTITPKLILFMYLAISFIAMFAWRMMMAETFGGRQKYRALLIGTGNEIKELYDEINNNPRYGTTFVQWIDPAKTSLNGEEIMRQVKEEKVSLIVADYSHPKIDEVMSTLYNLIFSEVRFADSQKMYEEVFDRVPLSLVNDTWFLQNISSMPKVSFDIFKRLTDIVVSALFGIISLIFYPFIILAIKLDDGGVIFSSQKRVGQKSELVSIYKFRTMTVANDQARWGEVKNQVTRVGKFLRKTRLDELPQLWNVFRGDISLIGPRPEFPEPVAAYAKALPYYNMRHIVKPGLSGWAQIYGRHPHHGVHIDETSEKLSYDLYYIKNRSILLDFKIALKTLKVLISFVGR